MHNVQLDYDFKWVCDDVVCIMHNCVSFISWYRGKFNLDNVMDLLLLWKAKKKMKNQQMLKENAPKEALYISHTCKRCRKKNEN